MDEQKISMVENGVPRQIVESKKDKITGALRRLDKEERYDPYHSANIIRAIKCIMKNEITGRVALWGRGEVHTGLWWRNVWERPRRRWYGSVKVDIYEVGFGEHGMD